MFALWARSSCSRRSRESWSTAARRGRSCSSPRSLRRWSRRGWRCRRLARGDPRAGDAARDRLRHLSAGRVRPRTGYRRRARARQINGYVETARYAGMTAGRYRRRPRGRRRDRGRAARQRATFALLAARGLLLGRAAGPGPAHAERGAERARDGASLPLPRPDARGRPRRSIFVSLLFMSASVTAEVFFLKESLRVGDALYGSSSRAGRSGWSSARSSSHGGWPARRWPSGRSSRSRSRGTGSAGRRLARRWLRGRVWFVGGVGHGTKNVLARTLIQERVPARRPRPCLRRLQRDAKRGRALRARGRRGARGAIGARVTLALAGGIPVLAAVIGLVLYRRLEQRDELPVAASPPQPS